MAAASLAGALLLAACGYAGGGGGSSPGAAKAPSSTPSAGVSSSIGFHTDADVPGPDNLPAPGGAKPLVPLSNVISGGPPPDGIPPIDHPKFTSPAAATFLASNEPVLSVTYGGQTKAYPLQILTFHEIVNDTIGGTPITVTFCPLCNTGIAFLRPTIRGHLLDFGTSGKLYDSNLLMYDRQTWTLWSQAIGEAVAGPLTGTKLTFASAQVLSWSDWRDANPDGLVLSRDTGFSRPYGQNPYQGYDDTTSRPFLFLGKPDPRLPPAEHVIGIDLAGKTVAFPFTSLARASVDGWTAVNSTVGGETVAVFWAKGTASALDAAQVAQGKDVGAATAYVPRTGDRNLTFEVRGGAIVDTETGSQWNLSGIAVSGKLEGTQLMPVVATNSLWFDWAAFHPDTAIWSQS